MRRVVGSSDILVIGAGIVGCAIAHELASRGAHVAILDERDYAGGATQASGGMLAPFSEAADHAPLLGLGRRSLEMYDSFVARVAGDADAPIPYVRTGTLHVAQSDTGLARLERLHANLAADGIAAHELSAQETAECEGAVTADVLGGVLIPTQGLVSAPHLTDALRHATARLGGRFLEPARVLRISGDDRTVQVETAGGVHQASRAVLAAGAWSGQIAVDGASAPAPVRPVRGQLLYLGWPQPATSRIVWNERCYTVPWADGTMLVGATVEDVGFDQRATVSGVQDLLAAIRELFPAAGAAELRSVRAGLRPATADGLPIVGWSEAVPGLIYATGHYRNGVLLAPLTAAVIADALLENRFDQSVEQLTRPARFGRL